MICMNNYLNTDKQASKQPYAGNRSKVNMIWMSEK